MRSHTRSDHIKRVKGLAEIVEEEVDPSKPIVGGFITSDSSEIRDSSIGIGGISHLADHLVDELSLSSSYTHAGLIRHGRGFP